MWLSSRQTSRPFGVIVVAPLRRSHPPFGANVECIIHCAARWGGSNGARRIMQFACRGSNVVLNAFFAFSLPFLGNPLRWHRWSFSPPSSQHLLHDEDDLFHPPIAASFADISWRLTVVNSVSPDRILSGDSVWCRLCFFGQPASHQGQ